MTFTSPSGNSDMLKDPLNIANRLLNEAAKAACSDDETTRAKAAPLAAVARARLYQARVMGEMIQNGFSFYPNDKEPE